MTASGTDGRRARIRLPEDRVRQARSLGRTVLAEPFQSQAWSELAFYILSGFVASIGALLVAVTFLTGSVLAAVFVGIVILAGGLRGARVLGAWQRALARQLLGERIPDPEPLHTAPGLWGWLRGTLRDSAGWRAVGYIVAKIPLVIFGAWFALRVWAQSLFSVIHALTGMASSSRLGGLPLEIVFPGYVSGGPQGITHRTWLLVEGLVLLIAAPWTTRLVVYLDRVLMRVLLGPDTLTARVRSLERSRAQTVDASAATLRRIERDLHDGTQAQLVALAMRIGQVKEKLAEGDQPDLDAIRRLVDEAHRGAKEAIVELRDLARGIHPPVLDTGLEAALSTLTARSPVPTRLSVSMHSRPTPAIEAISYFCVAELLANVAQHARATRAQVTCAEHGPWLRLAVSDDGRGGAALNGAGTTSSGLAGLTDRVTSVDGHLSIASPHGGPTVITVDLPLHA